MESVVPLGGGEDLHLNLEPVQVFQRALWRHPAADDVILHAERREVTTTADQTVKTWQWFLAVQPGAELRAWLDTNPFALQETPAGTDAALPAPPPWFPSDLSGYTRRQDAGGRFIHWYSPAQNLLYATDSGAGFAPAANTP